MPRSLQLEGKTYRWSAGRRNLVILLPSEDDKKPKKKIVPYEELFNKTSEEIDADLKYESIRVTPWWVIKYIREKLTA